MLLDHDGASVAEMAANDLRGWRSDLSAHTPVSRWLWLALATIVVLFSVSLFAGGLLWVVMSLLAGSILAGSIVLRLFAAAGSCDPLFAMPGANIAAGSLSDADLPVFTIIVALYREARIVRKLTAALDAIDYPACKLDIKLVIECDDVETREAFESLALPARYEILVVPEGKPKTKPRALNAALPLARGEYVCVFDAEDIPDPGQLRQAAAAFARSGQEIACVQARLAIDNVRDSWLTRMFAIEYAALFDVLNPGFSWLRVPVPLGGTSNHFRTAVLRRLRGWDAWNVTEDIDLGLRLARFGYRVEAIASATEEEAPARLSLWMRQRRRWLKGWMQTALVHFHHPLRFWREMGGLQASVAFLHVVGTLLGCLLGPLFAIVATVQIAWGDLLTPTTPLGVVLSTCWCFVFVAGLASAFWPVLLGMKRRKLLACSGWLITLPAYWLLQTIAAWWAMVDLVRDPFHWHKTDHGLALTTRRQKRPVTKKNQIQQAL